MNFLNDFKLQGQSVELVESLLVFPPVSLPVGPGDSESEGFYKIIIRILRRLEVRRTDVPDKQNGRYRLQHCYSVP